jgi:hypothetical protein
MSGAEVARLLELRDVSSGRPEGAPPPRGAGARVPSLEHHLLRGLLAAPELAAALRVEQLDENTHEAQVLREVLEVLAAGRVPPKPLSTAFEGTPLLPELQALEAELLRLGFDTVEQVRPEFDGALRKLEARQKDKEIKAMIGRRETEGLAEQLRESAALRQPGAAPLSAGTDTPSKGL